jgi:predicted nucleic acid-binding protein
MKVIDTSAWIEWLKDSPTANALHPYWPNHDGTVVPTLVQLELMKWMRRELSDETIRQVTALTERCIIIPLDTRLALKAAELCAQYRLSTADAVVYATALEAEATLLTCDAHFEGLPSVDFIRKA